MARADRPAAPATILLVEDDADLRSTCARLLGVWAPGATIVAAEDGATALAASRQRSPILMLVDRRLPDIDGAELIRSLKEIHPIAHSVLMTGGQANGKLAPELAAYIDGVLQKPFEMDQLAALVRSIAGSDGG